MKIFQPVALQGLDRTPCAPRARGEDPNPSAAFRGKGCDKVVLNFSKTNDFCTMVNCDSPSDSPVTGLNFQAQLTDLDDAVFCN